MTRPPDMPWERVLSLDAEARDLASRHYSRHELKAMPLPEKALFGGAPARDG